MNKQNIFRISVILFFNVVLAGICYSVAIGDVNNNSELKALAPFIIILASVIAAIFCVFINKQRLALIFAFLPWMLAMSFVVFALINVALRILNII